MLKVLALTGGRNVPSARFRVRQYVEPLRTLGIALREACPHFGRYPPASKLIRPLWAALSLADRLPAVAASFDHDITLLQRELLSTYATFERFTARPRVLDVDDAIFLRGNGFARRIAETCEAIICGNVYLAEYFSSWHRNVHILPTAVDTARYVPSREDEHSRRLVVGWIGTSANLPYLEQIEAPLARLMSRFPSAKLRIVCDAAPVLRSVSPDQVEYWRWSQEVEVAAISGMTVGLMPLAASPWARGKCSFKMLQYLSCAVPTVASPVGMNCDIAALGDFARMASSDEDWYARVGEWLDDPGAVRVLGAQGREAMKQHFSVNAVAPRLASILRGVSGDGSSSVG